MDLKSQLVKYLAQNPHCHSKTALTEMVWVKNKFRQTRFAPETVGRKLRLAAEEGQLYQYTNEHGHAQYRIASGKEQEKPRKIIRWDTILRDGVPYARPIYE